MLKARLTAFLLAIGLAGCGGRTDSVTDQVSIGLTPATASTRVNTTVGLQASGNLPKYTNVTWSIDENGPAACTVNETPPQPATAPATACPLGWISVVVVTGNIAQTLATFHAVSATGTVHVRARAELTVNSAGVMPSSAEATSVITVTP